MSSASSARCALRRPPPPFPLIGCPDCDRIVKKGLSGTSEHLGWIYYKCKNHGSGCNFWHWEREYIAFLCESNYLRGDAGVEAYGWADERREELELRKEEAKVTRVQGQEQKLIMILEELRDMKVVLKTAMGVICLLCALVVVLILKK